VGPTQPPIQWVGLQTILSLRVKRLGRVVDHLPVSTAEVKNVWSHTFILPYGFVSCAVTILPLS
jgi:hypothetical protein